MTTETITKISCPYCSCNTSVKNGIIRGEQRYRCSHCHCNFVPGKRLRRVVSDGVFHGHDDVPGLCTLSPTGSHNWYLGPNIDGYSRGRCRYCKETRVFNNNPVINFVHRVGDQYLHISQDAYSSSDT